MPAERSMRMSFYARTRNPMQSTVSFNHLWKNKAQSTHKGILYPVLHIISVLSPFFFWFLINMTPWSRTIHVLRLLPLTFILSITMAENDLLMDIHVQFQKMSSQSVCSRGLIIFLDLVSSCLKHHCFIFFAMDLIPSSVSLCNT